MNLLVEKNEPLEIIHYLETPPDREALETILSLLGLAPRALMRTGEPLYQTLELANSALSREDLVNALLENPILIERPIVVKKGKAAIGRPIESVIDIL